MIAAQMATPADASLDRIDPLLPSMKSVGSSLAVLEKVERAARLDGSTQLQQRSHRVRDGAQRESEQSGVALVVGQRDFLTIESDEFDIDRRLAKARCCEVASEHCGVDRIDLGDLSWQHGQVVTRTETRLHNDAGQALNRSASPLCDIVGSARLVDDPWKQLVGVIAHVLTIGAVTWC